ncbi:MAG TPA: hypothetical protein VL096_21890, partial [Pirellulaceae bacterium]|nr:hypothetical protein [Pirellulaceae bacterium]
GGRGVGAGSGGDHRADGDLLPRAGRRALTVNASKLNTNSSLTPSKQIQYTASLASQFIPKNDEPRGNETGISQWRNPGSVTWITLKSGSASY